MDRRSRRRCHHHHRRHRLYRPRRDAGGDRAAVRKADGWFLDRVPHAEPRQDRRRRRSRAAPPPASPAPPSSSACRDRRAPAATAGTAFSPPSSITAPGRAISSRSCRGWTSICGGRRRRALRSRPSFRGDAKHRTRNLGDSEFWSRFGPSRNDDRQITTRAPRSRRSGFGRNCDAARWRPARSRRPDKFCARRPGCSGSTA